MQVGHIAAGSKEHHVDGRGFFGSLCPRRYTRAVGSRVFCLACSCSRQVCPEMWSKLPLHPCAREKVNSAFGVVFVGLALFWVAHLERIASRLEAGCGTSAFFVVLLQYTRRERCPVFLHFICTGEGIGYMRLLLTLPPPRVLSRVS